MSYNGSGTFVINSAGTPYTPGTVISSTAANALNSDLATGLTTAITKDGQTTPTANIPLGGFKITNLGAGTVASDAARLSQVQNSTTTTIITVAGTDTITGTVTPTLTAYTLGQVFSFVVAATNTGAVTLNINSLGAIAVTRTGSVALVAGDMVTGQIAIVEYDGTRFQLINGNSFTNLKASGTLGVTGATTLSSTLGVTGATTLSSTLGVTGAATLSSTLGVTGATTLSSTLGVTGATTLSTGLTVTGGRSSFAANSETFAVGAKYSSTAGTYYMGATNSATPDMVFSQVGGSERMRITDGGNVLIGTTTQVDGAKLSLYGGSLGGIGFATSQVANTVSMAVDSVGGFTTRKDSADFWYFGRSGSANCVSSGGSWVNSSDERLKENIVTLPDALNKVCSLRGVSFNRISSGQPEIGLIAQEVQEVYPDVVEVGDYLGLNYGALVGALVEAIKDLKTITEAQAARITALETL